MKRFDVVESPISGLYELNRVVNSDSRGFFSRLFCQEELNDLGFIGVAQVNHTLTKEKGSVRGLHFQRAPFTETKIVTCIRGQVLDFAVDLRINSPTYMKHHCTTLSEENNVSFYIPDGFAHGFQALSPDCELVYMHSCSYYPASEDVLNFRDPILSIDLPLSVTNISDRDLNALMIDDKFEGVLVK